MYIYIYTKDICVSFLASFHCLAMFFFFFCFSPKNVHYKFSYIIILNVLLKTYSSIYKLYIRNAYQNILVSIFIWTRFCDTNLLLVTYTWKILCKSSQITIRRFLHCWKRIIYIYIYFKKFLIYPCPPPFILFWIKNSLKRLNDQKKKKNSMTKMNHKLMDLGIESSLYLLIYYR